MEWNSHLATQSLLSGTVGRHTFSAAKSVDSDSRTSQLYILSDYLTASPHTRGIEGESEYLETVKQAHDRMKAIFEFGHTSSGTGLGLTLVRKVVCIHGGEINVNEEESGGARFEITLPAPDVIDHVDDARGSELFP